MIDSFAMRAQRIRHALLGEGARIETPFGSRLLCYADLTATGRLLAPVEAYIARIAPYYANSHTLISSTGAAMTRLREQARAAVGRAVHAGPEDVVVFVGSGATAAVNKLVGVLGLRLPDRLEEDFALCRHIPAEKRPVVFIGPYEHHSNELPWLESVAEVVEIGLNQDGEIDLGDLQRKLGAYAHRPVRIGSFSAASNVTGVLSDTRAIARVLHAHGALAFFDFAAAGPYVPIDMHASKEDWMDAVFLSPHKIVGGPQASGILVAHQSCFRCRVPERPGGGTVDYVASADHASVDYTHSIAEREEGGTPAILGDVRAAAALVLKAELGPEELREHEVATARRALARIARHPRLRVLGPLDLPRLPIVAVNVVHLHHDFVAVLLDHLFGIQNRAGCDCAGPYGHRLLGIDRETSERYRRFIARGILGVKPGWVRLSLPYYADEAEIDFILSAVEFVADHGEAFLSAYRLCWTDGVWRHHSWSGTACPVPELRAESLWAATPQEARRPSATEIAAERARYFVEAQRWADELGARAARERPIFNRTTGDPELDALIWFRYAETVG
jgi:selenocysteine lyase/cysteine desulfurase